MWTRSANDVWGYVVHTPASTLHSSIVTATAATTTKPGTDAPTTVAPLAELLTTTAPDTAAPTTTAPPTDAPTTAAATATTTTATAVQTTFSKVGKCCREQKGAVYPKGVTPGKSATRVLSANTLDQCQRACTSNPACHGIYFDSSGKTRCSTYPVPVYGVRTCTRTKKCYSVTRSVDSSVVAATAAEAATTIATAPKIVVENSGPACANGRYQTGTSTATQCTSKRTTCGTGTFFKAGSDSEKTKDDTTCPSCANGTYKTGTSAAIRCASKNVSCSTGKLFAAGTNADKTKDDTKCTTPADKMEWKSGPSFAFGTAEVTVGIAVDTMIVIGVSGVLLEGLHWPVDPWVDSDRRPGDIPGMIISAFRISRMSPGPGCAWGGLLVLLDAAEKLATAASACS